MTFNDVAIVSIKGSDYKIHFWYMSKYDAISIMHNSNLSDKTHTHIAYYERNRDVILKRAQDYYENNKEILRERERERERERAKNKYRELPENEKNVKRQYQKDIYHNMTAEAKQRLKEYQYNYREIRRANMNMKY